MGMSPANQTPTVQKYKYRIHHTPPEKHWFPIASKGKTNKHALPGRCMDYMLHYNNCYEFINDGKLLREG